MNDDVIIQQRISGRSARAIARAQGCTLTEVNRVLDCFTETTIDDKTRKHTLALELARLDELPHLRSIIFVIRAPHATSPSKARA